MAAILSIDVVGFSKLTDQQQREVMAGLNAECRSLLVRALEFRGPKSEPVVAALPTGDGMVICLCRIPVIVEDPGVFLLDAALSLWSWARQKQRWLRIGIHAGELRHVVDVNGRTNFCGCDLNLAQRAMDCGEPGHILCSDAAYRKSFQNSASDGVLFEPLSAPYKVKNGDPINLYNVTKVTGDGVIGNPTVPLIQQRCRLLPHPAVGLEVFTQTRCLTVVGLTNDGIAGVFEKELSMTPRRSFRALHRIQIFYCAPRFWQPKGLPPEKMEVPLDGVAGNASRDEPILRHERETSLSRMQALRRCGLEIVIKDSDLPPIAAILAGDYEDPR